MPIDPDIIRQLKDQYGKIFQVSIVKVDYIFRALTFREYDQLSGFSIADAEEAIVDLAILWPGKIDFLKVKPGIITTLAEEIIDCSGFSDIDSARALLEEKREKAQSFRFNMKAFVLATQPNITEDELDNMTLDQLTEKVAMAERIIAIQQAILGVPETGVQLDIIDPEEEVEVPKETREFKNTPVAPDYKPSNLGAAVAGDPIAAKLKAALGG